MAIGPQFSNNPIIGIAQIATANTARDGTGTVGTVATAQPAGTVIEKIQIKATGTTTAGMIRIFIHDGTNFRLYDEVLVTAITPSATLAAWVATYTPSKPIILPNGYSLRASTEKAETFNVFAEGGNL